MVSTVTNVTSLTRSGLADYLIQRITAVVLALFTLFVLGFLLTTPHVTHAELVSYFGGPIMKLFSILAVTAMDNQAVFMRKGDADFDRAFQVLGE